MQRGSALCCPRSQYPERHSWDDTWGPPGSELGSPALGGPDLRPQRGRHCPSKLPGQSRVSDGVRGGSRRSHLGVLIGVHGALHTQGLGAQDLTVPLQGVQLEQAGC